MLSWWWLHGWDQGPQVLSRERTSGEMGLLVRISSNGELDTKIKKIKEVGRELTPSLGSFLHAS